MRICIVCKKEKDIKQFGVRRCRSDGIHSVCKLCISERQARYYPRHRDTIRARNKEYRERNKKQINTARVIEYHLRHNISLEQRDEIFMAQGSCCALCGSKSPGGRFSNWQVDHDHACCPGPVSCGKCVRGLLCCSCNFCLGSYEKMLANGKVKNYLKKPPAKEILQKERETYAMAVGQ